MQLSQYDQYWEANPDADYWYYSPTLRALNPRRTGELLNNPRPWPEGES